LDSGETLYVTDAAAWRSWLEANYASAAEIWLVSYSRASGKPSIAYNEAVEEALCFGWIDSTNKKLDMDSRAQRYTPIQGLIDAKRMTQTGLDAISGFPDEPFVLPADISAVLKSDEQTGATSRPSPRATSSSAWAGSREREAGRMSSGLACATC
jgi:hypothetical protein